MIKLKYVGAKIDGERAFKDKTGIEWFPGSEHEVNDEHAAEMLRHPDVFAKVDGKPTPVAKATLARAESVDDQDVDDAATAAETQKAPDATVQADPLDVLDDAGVRALAKANGLKIQGIALLKGKNLRAKVGAALAK